MSEPFLVVEHIGDDGMIRAKAFGREFWLLEHPLTKFYWDGKAHMQLVMQEIPEEEQTPEPPKRSVAKSYGLRRPA